MTNKKISLIIFLVVIVGSIVLIQTTTKSNDLVGCAIPNDYLEKLETNRLILELDMVELPNFIGKEFEVNFTAVTKADFITVSMFFDGLSSYPVWEETADFFVNRRARIDLEDAEIITGIDHEFTIRAYDSDNNSDSITKTMSIDMINPTFLQLSLEKCSSEEGIEPELVEGGYLTLEESKSEYLRINYTAYDENFKCVKFFIDTREDVEVYPFSSTAFFGNAYFIIDNPFLREQTFMFKISAFDLAGNEESFIWQIRYIEEGQGNIPEWQYEQDLAAKDKEREEAKSGAFWGAFSFGLFGAVTGVFAAKNSRDNLPGYAGWRDLDGLVKIKDKEKFYKEQNQFKRIFKSKFGSYFAVISIIAIVVFVGAIALGFITIKESYFLTYFLRVCLPSLMVFFLIIFSIAFQMIKGEYNDLFTNFTHEPKNEAGGYFVSFFSIADKKYLISNSIIDIINEELFSIDFSEKDKMSYYLGIRGKKIKATYIPAEEVLITKEGIKIKQYEMMGFKHIQEILDGKDEEARKNAKTLSDINNEIAIQLKETKNTLQKTKNNIYTLAQRQADENIAAHTLTLKAMNDEIVLEDIPEEEEEAATAKKKLEGKKNE